MSESNLRALLLDVEAHAYFQNLANVTQLGTLGYFFPNAGGSPDISYTRLEHSKGTAVLGWRLGARLMTLTADIPFPLRVTAYHAFVLELACLLHDIGHGPLSHQFDMYIEEAALPGHEARGVQLARFLLEDCWCSGVPTWRQVFPTGITTLHAQIRALIMGEHCDTLPPCLAETLHASTSHALDLDRMDYIPRDASILMPLSDDCKELARRAIDRSQLSEDFQRLEFEPISSQLMLLLRQRLYEKFYDRTSEHADIFRRAMLRMGTPELLCVLYLKTREDAHKYLLLYREDHLLRCCEAEGLMVHTSHIIN